MVGTKSKWEDELGRWLFDVPVWRMISLVPVGAHKHDVCSPNVLLRGIMVLGDRFKPTAIWSCNLDGNPGAHA